MLARSSRRTVQALGVVFLTALLATMCAFGETGPQSSVCPPMPVDAQIEQAIDEVAGNRVANGSFERREAGQPPNHIETLQPGSKDLAGWEIIDPLGKPGLGVGDFGESKEDRRTDGWTIDWIGPTRWLASHGRQCLDLDGGVRQSFATEPGRQYELRFDAAANPEQGPNVAHLRVLIDDARHEFTFDSKRQTAADLGWSTLRIEFTAERKETTLTFFNTAPTTQSAGVALDNVVVKDPDHVELRTSRRYRVTDTSEGPILLDSNSGQTWRLATQEGQPVWLPIRRAGAAAPSPLEAHPRQE